MFFLSCRVAEKMRDGNRSSETFRRPFSEHSNHAFGTHDDGFDGDLSVHFGDGAEFADAAFVGQQLDFENKLVAGDDLAFETASSMPAKKKNRFLCGRLR